MLIEIFYKKFQMKSKLPAFKIPVLNHKIQGQTIVKLIILIKEFTLCLLSQNQIATS